LLKFDGGNDRMCLPLPATLPLAASDDGGKSGQWRDGMAWNCAFYIEKGRTALRKKYRKSP
jgi:hypothetical protein